MQTERTWLRWVRRTAGPGGRAELRLGIGDDAALLRPRRGWELAVTTDLMIETVHFLRERDTARTCGWRLATRALSDLAAMGAEPLAIFVSTAFPADLSVAWPRGFYRGLLAASSQAGAALAGGDVSASPDQSGGGKIFLDVTGIGQLPAGTALRRSGASAGDRILVSGVLGSGALGRALAHSGRAPANPAERAALRRHRQPGARWELGLRLRRQAAAAGVIAAAIDLSDGLGTDLDHLCQESQVGAEIRVSALPVAQAAGEANGDGAALERALYGGEDYELLFTLPAPKGRRKLLPPPGCTEIGQITAGGGLWLAYPDGRRQRLRPRGWEHFRKR